MSIKLTCIEKVLRLLSTDHKNTFGLAKYVQRTRTHIYECTQRTFYRTTHRSPVHLPHTLIQQIKNHNLREGITQCHNDNLFFTFKKCH